jgi:hypothetical protein
VNLDGGGQKAWRSDVDRSGVNGTKIPPRRLVCGEARAAATTERIGPHHVTCTFGRACSCSLRGLWSRAEPLCRREKVKVGSSILYLCVLQITHNGRAVE